MILNNGVIGRRIFWVNGRLLFVGENGGRVCLALGRRTRGGSQRRINNQESLLELLPRGTDPVEYLRDGEKVETFIVLPYDEGNGRNTGGFLAVATSVRVMILVSYVVSYFVLR